jgi:hypothetical protein
MYSPKPPPFNPTPEDLARYLSDELQSIAQSQYDTTDFVALNVLHAEPRKPRAGVVACADGTNWNPTATGFGFYGYNGSAWVKLG